MLDLVSLNLFYRKSESLWLFSLNQDGLGDKQTEVAMSIDNNAILQRPRGCFGYSTTQRSLWQEAAC